MFDLWMIPVAIIAIYLLSSIKILREDERGVIFRLGRVLPQPKGPGIALVFAPVESDGANIPSDRSHGSSRPGCDYS